MTKTPTETTEETRRLARAMYDAFQSGDATALGEVFAEDLVDHQPPFLPWGGDYHTLAGFGALGEKISAYLDVAGMRVERILADGDKAIGLLRFPDLKTGEDTVVIEEVTVRDGKVVETRLYYNDTKGIPLNSAGDR
ncbi:nuclear transport factor 2 family protein [Streptomyces sp. NPDC092903]|uniref:nuclear transport factor 2 family protein n=1 Tax=Streptomyces sp. NPDC092903 TaxID=3366017 RepID=UPI0037FED20F